MIGSVSLVTAHQGSANFGFIDKNAFQTKYPTHDNDCGGQ